MTIHLRYQILLVVLILSGRAVAQVITYPDIIVQGNSLIYDSNSGTTNDKIILINTAAGFVNIEFSLEAWISERGIYFQTSRTNSAKTTIDLSTKPRDAMKDPSNLLKIYLKPDEEFVINKFDKQNDTLMKSYVIKRPKLIPELELSRSSENKKEIFAKTSSHDSVNKVIRISEGMLDLTVLARQQFNNPVLGCSLANMNSKATTDYPMSSNFQQLFVEANTDYELRCSYQEQVEVAAVFYIKVKPHWYQSFLFYGLLIFFVAMLAIASVLLISRKRIRRSKDKQAEMEQSALRLQGQLNPHFTFNALSSIQGLMNTGRTEEANDYLEKFSTLLRKTLAGSNKIFNRLDLELQMMETYIKLEALRFNFEWKIDVDETLNSSEIEIPTLIIQPLIENAIRHGIAGLGKDGSLLVHCKRGRDNDTLIVSVKDNGKWKDKKSDSGFGLSLTEKRIQSVNKLSKERSMEFTLDRKFGTEATLIFYHWL